MEPLPNYDAWKLGNDLLDGDPEEPEEPVCDEVDPSDLCEVEDA